MHSINLVQIICETPNTSWAAQIDAQGNMLVATKFNAELLAPEDAFRNLTLRPKGHHPAKPGITIIQLSRQIEKEEIGSVWAAHNAEVP